MKASRSSTRFTMSQAYTSHSSTLATLPTVSQPLCVVSVVSMSVLPERGPPAPDAYELMVTRTGFRRVTRAGW
jgi:hypothetical protein